MQDSAVTASDHVFSLFMSGKTALPLRAGELVRAEVLSMDGNAVARIRLKNAVMEVKADAPLRAGDMLTLRVEHEEYMIYLRLAGHGAEEAGFVKGPMLAALNRFEGLSSGTEGMARLVTALRALPATLTRTMPEVELIGRFLLRIEDLTGATLKHSVENGGVFFEAKLRILALGMEAEGVSAEIEVGRIIVNDLKASLLRLKEAFLSPPVLARARGMVNADELIGAVNTVLRNIEYCQLQSKLNDSLQFFLPLVWPQLRDGEIVLREYDHGNPGERTHACTVNLDLERAGKAQIHALSQGGYLRVVCAAEKEKFASVLRDGAADLKAQFATAGLRLGFFVAQHRQTIDFESVHPEGWSISV